MSVEVGNIVEGVVTGITNFGAFVELDGGETGLIHISEVADTYVKDVKNYLEMNEKVEVKVISIDDEGKIGLSIKQLGGPSKSKKKKFKKVPKKSFEDRLSDFLKESSQRQQDIRNNIEKKSGHNG